MRYQQQNNTGLPKWELEQDTVSQVEWNDENCFSKVEKASEMW